MKTNLSQKLKTKTKSGPKASGLRDLPPDAARYAVNKAMLGAVRDAVSLQRVAAKLPGATGSVPTLERMLKGDLEMAAILVANDGEVQLQAVLRSTSYEKQLISSGVPAELIFVAKAFKRNVDAGTIGKLTGGYGAGVGGGSSAEPERVLVAIDTLVKAQKTLTRNERLTVWGVLVFDLPLIDIGWALYGGRGLNRDRLIERAASHLECALERMQPWYLAHA